MAMRRKLSKKFSRKLFTRTAKKTNSRNTHPNSMRGGYRL